MGSLLLPFSPASHPSALAGGAHAMLIQSCFGEKPAGLLASRGTARGMRAPGQGCWDPNSDNSFAFRICAAFRKRHSVPRGGSMGDV